MNLPLAFARAAVSRLDKTAAYWGDAEFSYGGILGQSYAIAQLLQSRFGVQTGDRVALWLKNCPEFISALFGIWSAGGVAVPINNFLKAQEVEFILKDAHAKTIISEAALA